MHSVEFDPDRLLDEVVTRIRALEVPARPRDLGGGLAPLAPVRFLRRRVVQAAAVLLVAALLGTFWLASPLGVSRSAFAQMQEALAATKTLSYQVVSVGPDEARRVTKVMCIGETLLRAEPPGELTILNFPEGAMLRVTHQTHTAVIDPLYTAPGFVAQQTDVFKKLRNIPQSAVKKIGERELDRRPVIDFLVNLDNRDQKVTVDAKTKLPVHIEFVLAKGSDGREIREEMTDFVFDAPLDAGLFRIEAPAGYAVTDHRGSKSTPPALVDDTSMVVSPESGIGPVKFGANVEETIRLLGKPDWQKHRDEVVKPQLPKGMPKELLKDKALPSVRVRNTSLHYDSRGFRLSVDDEKGLTFIQGFNQRSMGPMVRDFQGQTKEGIRLGATWDDVLKAYGEPSLKSDPNKGNNGAMWYNQLGWVFEFRNGKLCVIRISKPAEEKEKK